MPRLDEIAVQVGDIEDVRHVLAACLNYFQARDLMEAQVAYTAQSYSPLTNEIARVSSRWSGYMGDYLLAAHESADDADAEAATSEELHESEEGAQSVTDDLEELPALPFGTPQMPKQQGRRVKAARSKLAETQGEEVEHGGE